MPIPFNQTDNAGNFNGVYGFTYNYHNPIHVFIFGSFRAAKYVGTGTLGMLEYIPGRREILNN